MSAKNLTSALFLFADGQMPRITVCAMPRDCQPNSELEKPRAEIEIESEEDNMTVELSLPIPALKKLMAAAQEFLDAPGEPDLALEQAMTCCHVGGSVN